MITAAFMFVYAAVVSSAFVNVVHTSYDAPSVDVTVDGKLVSEACSVLAF